MTPCAHCPVLGETCPAIRLAHPTFCAQVDPGHPRYQPGRAAALVAMVGRPPAPPAPRPPDEPVALLPVGSLAERLELAKGCDYRGEMLRGADGGCGCERTWHCGAGRGTFASNPFEVSLSECLSCVSARPSP